MGIFKLHFENKMNIILITTLVWGINFRSTFKNNSDSMGLGSCWVLRFDPMLPLIKNIICIFYLIIFYYEMKITNAEKINEQIFVKKQEGNQIKIELTDLQKPTENMMKTIEKSQNLNDQYSKILFWLKIVSLIFVSYITEELYFILSNNHVLDRVIVPIRNCGIILALLIFSPILLKTGCRYKIHQLIPFLIVFFLSFAIILYNVIGVPRFLKKFKAVNSSIYYSTYFLMGVEIVIIKHLVDHQYISIFLILGIKGIIGTIVFTGINIACTGREFYDFLDSFLEFEYDDMYDEFGVGYKIIYIISLVLLQYLKIYIINKFSENHLQMVLMLTDLFYFPFYLIERFPIQHFGVFDVGSFSMNTIDGLLNIFLMLIFNEMLECNFWGLNKDLTQNINQRLDIENKDNDEKLMKLAEDDYDSEYDETNRKSESSDMNISNSVNYKKKKK